MKRIIYCAIVFFFFLGLFVGSAYAVPTVDSGSGMVIQNGFNATASPGDDVYSADGTYSFLDVATSLMMYSSSANDAAAGTGCRTVLVEGLDGSYNYQSETVTLAGGTPVTLANTYIRINKLSCVTVGSGGINAALIGLTGLTSTSNVYYGQIPASYGISQQAVYTAPLNKKAALEGYDFSCGASSTCQVAVQLQMREYGKSWQVLDTASANDSAGIVKKLFGGWVYVPPKADIRLRVLSVGTSGQRVNGSLQVMQSK